MANGDKQEVIAMYPNAFASHEGNAWVIRLSRTGDTRIINSRPATSAQLAWKGASLIARNTRAAFVAAALG